MSTIRTEPTLVGSNTPPCVSKNDCSTDTYMAILVRVIIHSAPTVGAEMSSVAAPNIETPPFAPQYHESVKARAFCGTVCAATTAGRRAAQASPAVNVRIVRIAEPLMTRVNDSAELGAMCRRSRSRGPRGARLPANSCQRRGVWRGRHAVMSDVMAGTHNAVTTGAGRLGEA